MKKNLYIFLVAFTCCSCIQNPLDSQPIERQSEPKSLRSLVTKSGIAIIEDSIMIMSKVQADVDNLMMGRVTLKDSLFVLAIKKEDALFLGVSESIYDDYLEYVDRLNESLIKRD